MTRAAAGAAGVALLAAAAVLFAVFRDGESPPRGDLLVTAGRVFDGSRLVRDGAVLIRGQEVVAVGERGPLGARAKRTIALGSNATVLPGFVDLHVHGPEDYALLLLSGGVTTVRDVGSPVEALASGDSTPLRILRAGPIVTAPGGYPIPLYGGTLALQVDGERDAREAVRRLERGGASVIKIAVERGFDGSFPTLRPAEIRAIVDEAHRRDLRVTAHVSTPADARRALSGGVDELAHMPCASAAPRLMQEFARRGVAIVGTLHIIEYADVESVCQAWLANARAFVSAGGTLPYGTDLGNTGIPPDIDVDELRLMREAGMTPGAIIRAATSFAGRQTGVENLGSLVNGAPADLIGVRGNPFRNLQALDQPQLVVAGGVVLVRNGMPTQALLGGL